MYTNEQPNDDPSLNRGSANKMNTNPAAGPPGAASQPGEPGAAAPLHAMSTPIQPYGADTVIYEKSDNFVQTSAGADVFMTPVNDTFSVPEGGATAVASLTVDDWGKLTISGPGGTFELDLTPDADEPGELGGHQEWTKSGSFELSEGTYALSITHQNIDMPHNEYNQSVCRYSVTVTAHGSSGGSSSSSSSSSSDMPPEEKEICCRCGTCTDAEGNEYTIAAEKLPGDPGVEICMSQAEFLAGGGAPSPAAFSLRTAENARETAEACGSLKYVSPWAWRAHLDETSGLITVVPPAGAALYFNVQAGSDAALPAGISRKRDFRVQLLDETLAPAASGAPAYLSLVDADGQKIRFSAETGAVVGMTSASGRVLLAEDYFRNVSNTYDHEGCLVSSYSAAEGLMRTRTGADGELVMEWYAPAAVTVLADGTYEVTGEPYKTSSYLSSEENGVRTTVITRQQRGLPAHTITRTEEPGRVSIAKGQGDDTIIRTIETNRLYGGLSERIETVRGINDAEPVACSRSVRQYTDGGWLLVSETEAFNTPLARTTSYEYNSQYRVSRINRPDGGYTRYEYDGEGRVTLEAEPWAGGGEQVTRTEYAGLRFYDNRPARVAESRVLSDGTEIELTAAAYAYERSPLMERVTKTVTAAGSGQEQTSVEETYGEAAAYPYAAGQTKFTRDIAGVETFYDYEAAAEHGAAHKKTAVTKVGGELAAGQSRKTESFLAANDTVLVEQESVWDGDNWLLLSSGAHEYDEEGRRTKTTRGNGRVTSTSWMCCGKLSETDEDGILTSYGYNSAHQLVETIRSAVTDGETMITPETITSYTRDALGKITSLRRDAGPMTTVESREYDLLGRLIRETDILGRTTVRSYSGDGLVETVPTPAGATLIARKSPSGTVVRRYGTGQQDILYTVEATAEGIRTTEAVPGGEGGEPRVVTGSSTVNGFGDLVRIAAANTLNGENVRTLAYDDKGRLIREQLADMAPTLYAYDAFGNRTRAIVALEDEPTILNSRITDYAYVAESREDGIYRLVSITSYTSSGTPVLQKQAVLLSALSSVLAGKNVMTDPRGQDTVEWTEYGGGSVRLQKKTVPGVGSVALTRVVDGFTTAVTGFDGATARRQRTYTETGITYADTDVRGNVFTAVCDIAGRIISGTDAAGNTTTYAYAQPFDLPTCVTNALGKTACSVYDIRGRKEAEWGTAIQPAVYAYDAAGHIVSLSTFRDPGDVITTDPRLRTDGDITTWTYDVATGLVVRKTYANATHVDTAYDALNRVSATTDARGTVASRSYAPLTGELTSITFNDDGFTPSISSRYNHLGQLTQIEDASGTRTFTYNQYNEQETETTAGLAASVLTLRRDGVGRPAGYCLDYAGAAALQTAWGHDASGRLSSVSLNAVAKPFTYGYNAESGLLDTLDYPNTLKWRRTLEEKRDLPVNIDYLRPGSANYPAKTGYSYDVLGRPVTKKDYFNTSAPDLTHAYAYNDRNELVSDAMSRGGIYSYAYDNIGNRTTSREGTDSLPTTYVANRLNQYTDITEGTEPPFVPTYDADGNQTKIRTATGVWTAEYNALNRPVRFTRTAEDGTVTTVTGDYDYMGRRIFKKVETTVADPETGESTTSVILNHRYLYRGYLQIAALDLTRTTLNALWYILWDPTEPVATRPLAIQTAGSWFAYGWDLTKNVMELYKSNGTIANSYSYAPFGEVTQRGNITNPLQWSSEAYDAELGMVYYNFRFYNPVDGRWTSRDPIIDERRWNVYSYVYQAPLSSYDIIGLQAPGYEGALTVAIINQIQDRDRIVNSAAHQYCDNYNKYKDSKCCDGEGRMVSDPYIPKACDMCHKFVDKYSENGKVIKPVECVAECLSEAEAGMQKIGRCKDRNTQRLINHVSCYINCGFYLISSKAIGTPEGGWKMGFEELLPDLIETKIIEPTSKQIENQGREIQKALDCNPYCSKYL